MRISGTFLYNGYVKGGLRLVDFLKGRKSQKNFFSSLIPPKKQSAKILFFAIHT
jgi:hypothetical protein